jgi:hypothetical protein
MPLFSIAGPRAGAYEDNIIFRSAIKVIKTLELSVPRPRERCETCRQLPDERPTADRVAAANERRLEGHRSLPRQIQIRNSKLPGRPHAEQTRLHPALDR